MRRVRVIPVLLLCEGQLVKTVRFSKPVYIGDPVNAVKIFNEKEVDEIMILDISANRAKRGPDFKLIREISDEAFMPLGYGGGITNIGQAKKIFSSGVEKIVLNSILSTNPGIVTEIAAEFGSQSLVVAMDVDISWFGKLKVYSNSGKSVLSPDPVKFAREMEDRGAGEIFLNNIGRDGTYTGYDSGLVNEISNAVKIPVVACGGASSVKDFLPAVKSGASAVAAGSIFVYYGPEKGILINYPSASSLESELYNLL